MHSGLVSETFRLFSYCRSQNWAGYDPYDALNSRLLASSSLYRSRFCRLAVTQALKRSPLNLRPLLGIPKTQNPKAIALFLSAVLKAPELCGNEEPDPATALVERLVALRSPKDSRWCWGYSFPWQTRSIVVPRGAANLVCTTFAAQALLDLYEVRHCAEHLAMAASAAEYILQDLYWSDGKGQAGFGYPLPSVRNQVHNANFLAAALLCRVYRLSGEERYLGPALAAARYSAAQQRADGSWAYGEAETQQWIDNFHTGYNLCALRSIERDAGTSEFDLCLQRGFTFYRSRFFREDGAPRYFHDRTYPIDIHCVAQSILTLVQLHDLDPDNIRLASSIAWWARRHMWDERGFFYYRLLRFGTVRTSYMRWSQAWMLLALVELIHGPATPERTMELREMSKVEQPC